MSILSSYLTTFELLTPIISKYINICKRVHNVLCNNFLLPHFAVRVFSEFYRISNAALTNNPPKTKSPTLSHEEVLNE
ncbi:hypothetical protein K445DRAFT_166804 [Daldinia sp. EC12]|nr:hypothetical protein K445DRAFT_166804 [Daldinia sp. EC12]